MIRADELICERCTYRLAGLRGSDVCPECGTPVAESLHTRRVEFPWQEVESTRTLFVTAVRFFRAPRRSYSTVRIEPARSFRWFCSLYAAAIMATAIGIGVACEEFAIEMVDGIDRWETSDWHVFFSPLFGWIPLTVALTGVYLYLTWVQRTGIARLARWNRYRFSTPAASAVVDFACAAWLGGAVMALISSVIGGAAEVLWTAATGRVLFYSHGMGLATLLVLFCAGCSVIRFEVYCLIGARVNRHANTPGSESQLASESPKPPAPAAP